MLDPVNILDDKFTFYDRVHLNVIAKFLKNILTFTGFKKIIQWKMDDITFTCPVTGNEKIDNLCLLYLLFWQVDPILIVSMESLCDQIETDNLHTFNNNVDELLSFEERHKKILANNSTCTSISRYTFNALLSVPVLISITSWKQSRVMLIQELVATRALLLGSLWLHLARNTSTRPPQRVLSGWSQRCPANNPHSHTLSSRRRRKVCQ